MGHWRFATVVETVGWGPGCTCPGNDGSGRCVVLDPFGGSGTTTLVAMSLDRDSIYIDLNREYAEMALERCGFRIIPALGRSEEKMLS
ncbi:site-specific DNA-methyltransferase [Desulfofundulus thermocisternus]|uniref:site-specific DNA-methyltransferase n=1 Tax=Desulfofundulus thermocisternus TaxID=42471 RepID=UPI00217CF3F7|nr:site-specific DNA-methyltransferase [Desulfofundulus thermocisternus]